MLTTERRFVIDTSTLIGAALNKRGTPRQAVVRAIRRGQLLGSVATFRELEATLHRPKFDPYLRDEDREAFIGWMYGLTTIIPVTETIRACRDPKDDLFLEVAISGQADALLSSDHDLLVLNPFRGLPIVSPATFLQRF
jgi:putative PIN family toxin of toxin-antitoxin system